MDEDVEDARRRFEADRLDEHAARQLQEALERSGRHDEVVDRFRMAFKCDQPWDMMEEIVLPDAPGAPGAAPAPDTIRRYGHDGKIMVIDGKRRTCRRCDKVVTTAWTAEELLGLVRDGACARIVAKPDTQGPTWVADQVAQDGVSSFAWRPKHDARALPCIIREDPPPPPRFTGFEAMGRVVRR